MEFSTAQWHLINRIAHAIHRRLPPKVEFGDLISDGFIGLHDASSRFDSAGQRRFEDYAAVRIRGAILDGLRQRAGTRRRLFNTRHRSAHFETVKADLVCIDRTPDQIDEMQWKQNAFARLSRRTRLMFQLYYLEGLTMRQTADCLGITESRISQLHKRTLQVLQSDQR
ncbi:MAG TPA: sigma-70 family RNA polymerase sigma factor [Tepidisphaeraceae bacterium]|nr:sigma-70 family RNA polymerase sigma factor [Tepidisphaeraceae bacterium]